VDWPDDRRGGWLGWLWSDEAEGTRDHLPSVLIPRFMGGEHGAAAIAGFTRVGPAVDNDARPQLIGRLVSLAAMAGKQVAISTDAAAPVLGPAADRARIPLAAGDPAI